MSQKLSINPTNVSLISGSSWLILTPDILSGLTAMGGVLLDTKPSSAIQVNQIIFSAEPEGPEGIEGNVNDSVQHALGIQHCYWLGEHGSKLSFSPALLDQLERILQYTAADTLFIPFFNTVNSQQTQKIEIIWQLVQNSNFQGVIYAYETVPSDSVNTLVDVSKTSVQKHNLIAQYSADNPKLADIILAGNQARTISLSEMATVDYVEGFFQFQQSANRQLFNAINQLQPIYQKRKFSDSQPLISIITRTKDRPELLQEAVSSVVAQNYPNIELIVVNDGGLDVWPHIQHARHQLYRVNYQNLAENVGRAAAANIGLQKATGDYVLFLDDDDLIDVDHLSALNDAIQSHSGVEVAYCGVRVGEDTFFNSPFNKAYLQVYNYIPIHAVLFSRQFIDMGCRFDESMEAFEDWDFWIQLSQYGDFYHLDKISGDYRQLGSSDGGTFELNQNVHRNRQKVLNKWRSQWSIEQFDAILSALRDYPTAKEMELHQLASGQYEELEHKKNHISNLEQKIFELNQRVNHLSELENQLSVVQTEQQRLQDENVSFKQQIRQLESDKQWLSSTLSQTQEQLRHILHSRIWRMTAPLRQALTYLYGLKHRFSAKATLEASSSDTRVSTQEMQTANRSKKTPENHSEEQSEDYSEDYFEDKELPFAFSQVAAQEDSHHPLFRQLFAQSQGNREHYVDISDYSADWSGQLKYIAFYLPQYHPIPENDEWWGRGFTEWSNVSKATPQFEGHYQPHLPDELGFYDLRLYEVLQRQVELAKQYGISGFCFHHYWFGGKRLLERPFQHIMEHPELDINFCLCWANENWTRRWDGLEQDVLMAQQHSVEDDLAFIKEIEPVLKDKRYIRVNGKPLLILYRPSLLPDAAATLERWRQYCRNNHIGEIFLVMAQVFGEIDPRPYGFDAAVEFPPHGSVERVNEITAQVVLYNQQYSGHVYDYEELVEKTAQDIECPYPLFRGIFPNWDNEARKPGKGNSFINSSPLLYQNWLEKVSAYALQSPVENESLVFINAWNEWGEGAHLEPDKKFGYAYLEATAKTLQSYNQGFQQRLIDTHRLLSKKNDIAVVLHLYYPELWQEIHAHLQNIHSGFDLYISLPKGVFSGYVDTILAAYPEAHLFGLENRGRDIGPFLEIFQRIRPLNYKYLCKLHSKKSLYFDSGAQWRSDLLGKLLGKLDGQDNTIDLIIAQFESNKQLGILAPKGYCMPLQPHMGSNQQIMTELMQRLGGRVSTESQFVAGSMFWCRPQSLDALASLNLGLSDFPLERGQRDGTLAHALERLFAQISEQNGYSVTEL